MTNRNPDFYALVGPFLSRREIVKQMGGEVRDDDDKIWFIAVTDGVSIGVSAVRIRTVEKAVLTSSYVRPSWRRQGVYTAMLCARLTFLQERGITTITTTASPLSRPVLERHGFVCTGTRRGRFVGMRMVLHDQARLRIRHQTCDDCAVSS